MTVDLPPTTVIALQWGPIELKLEQVEDLSSLAQTGVAHGEDPYWAYLWPSAHALMGALAALAHQLSPDDLCRAFAGRRALDLGCGLGGVGVLAAMLGAEVTVADIRPEATAMASRNAALNDVEVTAVQMDFHDPPAGLGPFDAILAADVLYGDGMLRGVLRFIKAHLAPTGRGFIADPMRVPPAGLAGAGRLLGLEVDSRVVQPGHTHTGGVTLHTITAR